MARNAIDKNRAALIALAKKMKMGLGTLGALLGITQMTAVTFGAVLSAFTAAQGNYNQARGNEEAAYKVYHANLAAIQTWLKVVRGVLVGYYGNSYNMNWAAAGFVQPSTAIPRKIADQVALVVKLEGFFTENPDKEVSDLDVTALQAAGLLGALDDGGRSAPAGADGDPRQARPADDGRDGAHGANADAHRYPEGYPEPD